MADVKRWALCRVGFWQLTIVNKTILLIRGTVELVESWIATADLEVGILEELDAFSRQWRSWVWALIFLEFRILLSVAYEASLSNCEMSSSNVISCERTQISIRCFWSFIEVFVHFQGWSGRDGCLASDINVVTIHLFFYFDSVCRVARYILLKDILVTVWVVWILGGRVYSQFKIAC